MKLSSQLIAPTKPTPHPNDNQQMLGRLFSVSGEKDTGDPTSREFGLDSSTDSMRKNSKVEGRNNTYFDEEGQPRRGQAPTGAKRHLSVADLQIQIADTDDAADAQRQQPCAQAKTRLVLRRAWC